MNYTPKVGNHVRRCCNQCRFGEPGGCDWKDRTPKTFLVRHTMYNPEGVCADLYKVFWGPEPNRWCDRTGLEPALVAIVVGNTISLEVPS